MSNDKEFNSASFNAYLVFLSSGFRTRRRKVLSISQKLLGRLGSNRGQTKEIFIALGLSGSSNFINKIFNNRSARNGRWR